MRNTKNEHGLTLKQEQFAQKFVECNNASEAYRFAYDTKTMKPATVNRRATDLKTDSTVKARIDHLRNETAKRHQITVDSLIDELEKARLVAIGAETPQTSAAVSATMGKAKLLGLDKQVLEHVGSVSVSINAKDILDFKKAFNDEF